MRCRGQPGDQAHPFDRIAERRRKIAMAEVAPEDVKHVEIGLKMSPTPGSTANFTFFDTHIEDFQTQVTNSQFGVARGYLANADKVRVSGAEFDGNVNIGTRFALRGSIAYTDAKYVSFTDAPPALEQTGGDSLYFPACDFFPTHSCFVVLRSHDFSPCFHFLRNLFVLLSH